MPGEEAPGLVSGIIYHLLPAARWRAQPPDQPYAPASLAAEGFIHCTAEPGRLVAVANAFYRSEPGPHVILCIRTEAVAPEVRWEPADGQRFPHIYGPLNLDAVAKVVPFPRSADGTFLAPPGLTER